MHGLFRNPARIQARVLRERLRGRHRIRAARSNRDDPIVRLDEIAGAGEQVRGLGVHDDEHRLETAERAIGAPILRKLHGGALEIAAVLFQLRLEAREQRERIRRGPREARENTVVVEAANLARALLDDRFPECDLAVARHDGLTVVPDGEHGGGNEHRQKLSLSGEMGADPAP